MDPADTLPPRHLRHYPLQHRFGGHAVSEARLAERPESATTPGMDRSQDVLTEAALGFVAELHRRFDGRRRALLEARAERQRAFDSGALPDFLPETASIRAGNWRVGDIPADLFDRRGEITRPTARPMVIHATNPGRPAKPPLGKAVVSKGR